MRKDLFLVFLILFFPFIALAQVQDSLPAQVSLNDCLHYALANQPVLQQAHLDEQIAGENISISLSGWYPQVNLTANLQHYLKLPVIFFPNPANPTGPKQQVSSGLDNTSSLLFSANQVIYSTGLFYAKKTSRDLRKLSKQNTESTKIELVVQVSKAFYDVLLTQQQINVLNEDILRLNRNYTDAFSRYKNGLTAKTDYQRTIISLNNAIAQRKSTIENIQSKYAILKQLMGLPPQKQLSVKFDSAAVHKEISIDTMQILNDEKRVEFRILQTNRALQLSSASYYKWSFLPTLSAFADYNIIFQNDYFSRLYQQSFPNSYIGLKLELPIFQGNLRLHNFRKANLLTDRLSLELQNLHYQLNTEYVQALSSYKSYLSEMNAAKENIRLARDIFNTVRLQYSNGIVTYLEVLVAETDLRTAQLNYLNTLFQVLSSILDVKKALGEIVVQ